MSMDAATNTIRPVPVELRPATSGDDAFLRTLSDDLRRAEFESFGVEGAALDQLLKLQFVAQRTQDEHTYPALDQYIIVFAGGSVGRMLVDETAERLYLVDLSVLSSFQRNGIGTAALGELIERSDRSGVPITLDLDESNPARRRCEQLGWTTVDSDGSRHSMRREPRASMSSRP